MYTTKQVEKANKKNSTNMLLKTAENVDRDHL